MYALLFFLFSFAVLSSFISSQHNVDNLLLFLFSPIVSVKTFHLDRRFCLSLQLLFSVLDRSSLSWPTPEFSSTVVCSPLLCPPIFFFSPFSPYEIGAQHAPSPHSFAYLPFSIPFFIEPTCIVNSPQSLRPHPLNFFPHICSVYSQTPPRPCCLSSSQTFKQFY